MNCIHCLESFNLRFHVINGGLLAATVTVVCNSCKQSFEVGEASILAEMQRLKDLEKALTEYHFYISNHPTLQRLSASDSKLDNLLCDLESKMNFDNISTDTFKIECDGVKNEPQQQPATTT